MRIVIDSIKDLDNAKNSPFYEFEIRLQGEYGVSLMACSFSYDLKSNESPLFTKDNLKTLFCTPRSGRNWQVDSEATAGDITQVSYAESKTVIDLYIFCSGLGTRPESKLDLPYELREQAQKNVNGYWALIGQYFSLPPSAVYKYEPYHSSWHGISWHFYFIYLNDKTRQGLFFGGNTFD